MFEFISAVLYRSNWKTVKITLTHDPKTEKYQHIMNYRLKLLNGNVVQEGVLQASVLLLSRKRSFSDKIYINHDKLTKL